MVFWFCAVNCLAQVSPDVFKNLKYRTIGPDGNRAIAIAGEPGNQMVTYIGALAGNQFLMDKKCLLLVRLR